MSIFSSGLGPVPILCHFHVCWWRLPCRRGGILPCSYLQHNGLDPTQQLVPAQHLPDNISGAIPIVNKVFTIEELLHHLCPSQTKPKPGTRFYRGTALSPAGPTGQIFHCNLVDRSEHLLQLDLRFAPKHTVRHSSDTLVAVLIDRQLKVPEKLSIGELPLPYHLLKFPQISRYVLLAEQTNDLCELHCGRCGKE
ncbi:MAG: hypothetical protein BJ554DRAFT_5206 [Olpidium bornovanus]|uniref:Uncharacterized protein n=1 Tax=Olpidium bornovanus TaxID=278681 RepID=A0A8H8DDH8_9FUNG|nr:MAG: hypothetical protein BJ554DRAFT_5206 [Olpidium bornovanus]